MLTGVILAGGHNRKMNGSAKALLPFCGEILVQRQVRIMKSICREIIIVTNEPKTYLPVLGNSVRIITDYLPGKGPLSGMHAAFSLGTSERLWVVGGDMPFLSARAVEQMLTLGDPGQYDAWIPFVNGEYYPLHGIYHKNCLQAVSAQLEGGRHEISELLDRINVQQMPEEFFRERGIETHFVTRINTTEEYHHAMQLNYALQLSGVNSSLQEYV